MHHLPYMSTIRNPIKFLNPFHHRLDNPRGIRHGGALEVLHAHKRVAGAPFSPDHFARLVEPRRPLDLIKSWTIFALILLGLSIAALLVLNASRNSLIFYMEDQAVDSQEAAKMAAFCIMHAMWFVVFLALSVLAITCIVSGSWTGPDAKWGWIVLGVLLVTDLARADVPWVR